MFVNLIVLLIVIAIAVFLGRLTYRAIKAQRLWVKIAGGLGAGLLTLLFAAIAFLGAKGMADLYFPGAEPAPDLTVEGTPEQIARGYLESFATGDPDAVTRWVTDDFVNEHTAALGTGCVGKDEYVRRVPGFLASMPGLRYDVEDVVADGDRAVAAYTLHTRVNDRDVAVRGVMRFFVRDGLIAKRIDYWDSLQFQRQAGLA